jgi:hypothetical protein
MGIVHDKLARLWMSKNINKLVDEWECFLLQAFSYFLSKPLPLFDDHLDFSSSPYNM